MSTYTLREWETLPHGEGEGCIPEHFAERLVGLARTKTFAGKGGGGVLEDRRHELRARGVVGVLATDGCSLEILPKIDVIGQQGTAKQHAAIRKRLIHMLAVALNLKIDTGQITELDWQRETLLEILIRIFCGKLTDVVRRGIPRRYILPYIAQVSSSVAGKSTDFLMRPLSHEFFCALALSAAKKHLNSVEMSPVRMPWRQDGRVFWNAGQTCPAAFVLFFFDEVWFSSGRRSRAYRW